MRLAFESESTPDRRSEVAAGTTIVVARLGAASGAGAAAAALVSMGSDTDRAGLLVELGRGRVPRPSLLATVAARSLEERLTAHLPKAGTASRGRFCHLALPGDAEGIDGIAAALPLVRDALAVVHLPPPLLPLTLAHAGVRPSAALLRADLGRDRSLAALVAGDLIERGLRVAVLKRQPPWLPARLALLGVPPLDGAGLPPRLVDRLLGTARGRHAEK